MKRVINNKGQVTAFVIVALVVVLIVFGVFLLNRNDVTLRDQDFDDPSVYLTSCIRERGSEILEDMLINGGFIESSDKVLYDSNQITYLCKNINNFEPCVNQYPLYVTQLQKEFNRLIQDDANKCFSSLKDELESRNFEVTQGGEFEVEAKLKPEVIEIRFIGDLTISKSDEARKFSRIDTYIVTKLQSIGFVVNEIVSQEAKWCYFSNEGFMTLYPEYDIKVYLMEDSTKIYTIKNKKSGEILKMATRGCVLPGGWF